MVVSRYGSYGVDINRDFRNGAAVREMLKGRRSHPPAPSPHSALRAKLHPVSRALRPEPNLRRRDPAPSTYAARRFQSALLVTGWGAREMHLGAGLRFFLGTLSSGLNVNTHPDAQRLWYKEKSH